MQTAIPYMQMRGGSSKGVYFVATDLPAPSSERDQVLLSAMGRDTRQIDGLGGAHPLTSKVAIVGPSSRPGIDVDYLFAQVVVGEDRVDTTPNCGNILAGVGPFAIEAGLVPARNDVTMVSVHMVNSGNRCEVLVQTPGGRVNYQGSASIDGVPGTAAPVICNYMDISGSVCGALLPTGSTQDVIEDVAVTCIDNGMPVVVIRAQAMGKSGYESCEVLTADQNFRSRLEVLRKAAGAAMGLEDVSNKVVPKMCLIAAPSSGGHLCTRTFIPHTCHSAIGVLGAVSVATAVIVPGTVANEIASVPDGNVKQLSIEHPSGEFSVNLEVDHEGQVARAGLLRTARLLSRGELYI